FKLLQNLITEYKVVQGKDLIVKLFPKDKDWANPFMELLVDMNEDVTLDDIHRIIHTNTINPEMPLDVPYVRIMSIHKSKGLTSEISIISGVIEGLVPRVDTELEGEESERFMEEQRRLFFVGITRPKK